MEDIATGSAAGPAGAFLCKHNRVLAGEPFVIKQGRFLGRPSEIKVQVEIQKNEIYNVSVSGQVCKVANIEFI
ncbi:PhzF family phenazine biosynthesis protein [Thalassotalea sp. ND16A]|uniref:PhzF family phenazine biosynthesis protein n=1 Tax=Thalassotalea sp. ND16A TaxID=1535422 RepID=UPI003FCD41B9